MLKVQLSCTFFIITYVTISIEYANSLCSLVMSGTLSSQQVPRQNAVVVGIVNLDRHETFHSSSILLVYMLLLKREHICNIYFYYASCSMFV